MNAKKIRTGVRLAEEVVGALNACIVRCACNGDYLDVQLIAEFLEKFQELTIPDAAYRLTPI